VSRLRTVARPAQAALLVTLRPARLGIRPVDVLATAVVIAAVQLNSVTATGPDQHSLDALTYTFGTVVALPVLLRRRWPRGVLIACSVLLFAFYSLARRNISPVPLLCLPLYDATAAGFLALAIVIPAFYMVAGLIVVGGSTHQSMLSLASEFLPSVVVLLLAVLLGDMVRSRRAIAAQTAERLRLAAAQREREAARRVAEERLRIARDLHDTVAHSMATIAVQAASALHVLGAGQAGPGASGPGAPGPGTPGSGAAGARSAGARSAEAPGGGADGAGTACGPGAGGAPGAGADAGASPAAGAEVPGVVREALSTIRDTSKAALADIRITLGELRGEEGERESAETRTAGLARLDALSDAVRAAGAPVTVVVQGDPGRLPPAVDHSAYRILQECLTNVLRHAGPQASAEVVLRYEPAALTIEVTDDGLGSGAAAAPEPAAGPGSTGTWPPPTGGQGLTERAGAPGGHGLTGMTERAEALGGQLTAGPRPAGGFAVTARLPLPAASAAIPPGPAIPAGLAGTAPGLAPEDPAGKAGEPAGTGPGEAGIPASPRAEAP
jgi:signal transduction histidine kinase